MKVVNTTDKLTPLMYLNKQEDPLLQTPVPHCQKSWDHSASVS